VEGVGAGGFETKHMHICQSLLIAISFKNVLKMIKNRVRVSFSVRIRI